jgi:hypothetical protein
MIVIVPGCPDRILAPNRRAHGREKAAATLQHRRDACFASVEAYMDGSHSVEGVVSLPLFTGPVSVAAHVRWAKGERVHDLDSCAVMVKPAIDGLVDAGIMANDSQMCLLTISQEPWRVSKTTGEVVLTIESIERREEAA